MEAKDLVMALEGLEREKNIKREDILKTIEDALVSALRKNLGKTAQISAKRCFIPKERSFTLKFKNCVIPKFSQSSSTRFFFSFLSSS